jgi:hypothetical protein
MQKKDRIYIAGILLLLAIFIFREGCHQSKEGRLVQDIQLYKDTAMHYKGPNDAMVDFNKTLVVNTQKELEAIISKNDTLLKLLEKFKDIKSTTIIREHFSIDHDTIRLTNQIPCDFSPIHVTRDSSNYYFTGTITRNTFSIDSLSIPNKQSIVVGTKKIGIFKHEKRVEIINSNPLLHTDKIQSYVINDKPKWFQQKWFAFTLGAVVGAVAAKELLSK